MKYDTEYPFIWALCWLWSPTKAALCLLTCRQTDLGKNLLQTSERSITYHCILFHPITFHCIPLPTIAYHYIPLYTIAYRYILLHTIIFHYISLHFVCIPLNFINYHYILFYVERFMPRVPFNSIFKRAMPRGHFMPWQGDCFIPLSRGLFHSIIEKAILFQAERAIIPFK